MGAGKNRVQYIRCTNGRKTCFLRPGYIVSLSNGCLIIFFACFLHIKSIASSEGGYLIATLQKHTGSVNAIAFSPDGKFFATGGDDKKLIVWDNATNEVLFSIDEGFYKIQAIAFSPYANNIAVASGRVIKLFEINGKYINTFNGHTTDVWSLSFSPDGRYIASGSFDKTFRLWEVKSGQTVHTFEGHEKSVLAVCFSPDGKYIASGSLDQSIKLWDVETKNEIRTYKGHFDNIYSIAFSPGGKYFISASRDKTIRLWDIEKEEHMYTFRGHLNAVFSVCFAPSGKFFLSSSLDKSVILWERCSGKALHTFTGHEASVNTVSISPDGKKMISASYDQSLKVWEVSPDIFVDMYFPDQIKQEMEESKLFAPKGNNEPRDEYRVREANAETFRKELYENYFLKYLELPMHQTVISNQQ